MAMDVTEEAVAIARMGPGPDDPVAIVYANPAYLRSTGATLDQVIGTTGEQFSGPKTDQAVLRTVRETLCRGEAARAEYVSYRLDGSHYYASASAQPLLNDQGETVQYVLMLHDITESVLRGAELAVQNERLTALTAIARTIFAALEPNALVEALINGVRDLVGAESRLLVARPNGGFALTRDLLVAERAPAAGDRFIESASRSDGALISEDGLRAALRIPGSLGQTRYILDIRCERRLHTADTFAVGLLGQYFAVAARNVELYGELQARRAAVVELNQVKNDLIAMLAHDFKGPLTTIVGFADVLAEDERFDEESRKFLTMISSSAMRLASLATDTPGALASRTERTHARPRRIRSRRAGARYRARVQRHARDRSAHRPAGASDRRRSGPAASSVREPDRQCDQVFTAAANRSKSSCAPRAAAWKSACAITASVSPRPIRRSCSAGSRARKNARALGISGTGFGLYLTKTIVEMHGGTMSVDSVEGEGSTFRAFLPAAVAAARPRHRRFILIDAEGDAKSYVAHTLRDDGFAANRCGRRQRVALHDR